MSFRECWGGHASLIAKNEIAQGKVPDFDEVHDLAVELRNVNRQGIAARNQGAADVNIPDGNKERRAPPGAGRPRKT